MITRRDILKCASGALIPVPKYLLASPKKKQIEVEALLWTEKSHGPYPVTIKTNRLSDLQIFYEITNFGWLKGELLLADIYRSIDFAGNHMFPATMEPGVLVGDQIFKKWSLGIRPKDYLRILDYLGIRKINSRVQTN